MSKNQKKKADPKPATALKKKGDQMGYRAFRCPDDLWEKVKAEAAGKDTFTAEIVRDALEKRYQK